jgi:hypothetical protein
MYDVLVLVLAGGGVGAAMIHGIVKLLEIRMGHKHETSTHMGTLKHALRVILHDRIKYLSRSYVEKNEVSFDDRRDLLEMHHIYHGALGGNGHMDHLISEVKKLQLK